MAAVPSSLSYAIVQLNNRQTTVTACYQLGHFTNTIHKIFNAQEVTWSASLRNRRRRATGKPAPPVQLPQLARPPLVAIAAACKLIPAGSRDVNIGHMCTVHVSFLFARGHHTLMSQAHTPRQDAKPTKHCHNQIIILYLVYWSYSDWTSTGWPTTESWINSTENRAKRRQCIQVIGCDSLIKV